MKYKVFNIKENKYEDSKCIVTQAGDIAFWDESQGWEEACFCGMSNDDFRVVIIENQNICKNCSFFESSSEDIWEGYGDCKNPNNSYSFNGDDGHKGIYTGNDKNAFVHNEFGCIYWSFKK